MVRSLGFQSRGSGAGSGNQLKVRPAGGDVLRERRSSYRSSRFLLGPQGNLSRFSSFVRNLAVITFQRSKQPVLDLLSWFLSFRSRVKPQTWGAGVLQLLQRLVQHSRIKMAPQNGNKASRLLVVTRLSGSAAAEEHLEAAGLEFDSCSTPSTFS